MNVPITGDAVNVANVSGDLFVSSVTELGKIGHWLEALGVIVILWIIFQIVSLVLTLSKMKMLGKLIEDIGRLEKKMDRKLSGIDNIIRKRK